MRIQTHLPAYLLLQHTVFTSKSKASYRNAFTISLFFLLACVKAHFSGKNNFSCFLYSGIGLRLKTFFQDHARSHGRRGARSRLKIPILPISSLAITLSNHALTHTYIILIYTGWHKKEVIYQTLFPLFPLFSVTQSHTHTTSPTTQAKLSH